MQRTNFFCILERTQATRITTDVPCVVIHCSLPYLKCLHCLEKLGPKQDSISSSGPSKAQYCMFPSAALHAVQFREEACQICVYWADGLGHTRWHAVLPPAPATSPQADDPPPNFTGYYKTLYTQKKWPKSGLAPPAPFHMYQMSLKWMCETCAQPTECEHQSFFEGFGTKFVSANAPFPPSGDANEPPPGKTHHGPGPWYW